MEDAVRWTIKVSKDTDLSLLAFLGSKGMKKGDLSKFVEEAVQAQVFHRTVQDIKARNADTDPDELQAIIDGAVREVRLKTILSTRNSCLECGSFWTPIFSYPL
ncbi:MAG TPA: ribbon-helix-helix domain-containing protein [Edaphobacter sp.]|nr:ribbon-helix-helix domain-containing protein [Edaphobacter sp.]